MKPIVIIMGVLLVLSFTVYGCKGKAKATPATNTATENQAISETPSNGYGPSDQRVIDEFNQVWSEVHTANSDKGGQWRLLNVTVASIRSDEKAQTATVNIKFIYKPGNKAERTKAADFLFHETAGSWSIDKDTAKYPIAP